MLRQEMTVVRPMDEVGGVLSDWASVDAEQGSNQAMRGEGQGVWAMQRMRSRTRNLISGDIVEGVGSLWCQDGGEATGPRGLSG